MTENETLDNKQSINDTRLFSCFPKVESGKEMAQEEEEGEEGEKEEEEEEEELGLIAWHTSF